MGVFETGKIYNPVSFLPGLTRTGRARPQATLREDAIMIVLGVFTLVALLWDGILHNNTVGQDTFFSPPHMAMYAGLTGLGVWIALVLLRHQENRQVLDISLIPRGYGLAVFALPLAALSGPADFIWHEAYGFENQIDSTYSPPHQGLFISGAMLAAIPAASAWKRPGNAPSLREFLPALFSVTAVASVMLFVIHQILPFYGGSVAVSKPFQDDLAGRADAYAGSTEEHREGLALALTNFGDDAWPYYFYSTHLTAAGLLLFTVALIGAILLMRRRWTLPVGSLTIMFTSLGLLFAMPSEYRMAGLIPALVLAGLAADVLLVRLVGDQPASWRMRLFAGLVPPILWALWILCIAVLGDGVGWGATLWTGMLTTSAGLGFMLSLTTIPPAGPPPADLPEPIAAAVEPERAVA
jgi:hypothetical protein